jgi:hypothetical protein
VWVWESGQDTLERRHARTAITDMHPTRARLTDITGQAGFLAECSSAPGRGITDGAEAAGATVTATTDTQPTVDALLHVVQWVASMAADFMVPREVDFTAQHEVASTVEADVADGSTS